MLSVTTEKIRSC